MRTLLLTASAATLAILSTVELATAAATIPDYALHVYTRSAYDRAPGSVDNGVAGWRAPVGPATSAGERAEPEWFEIPARR